MKVEDVQFDRQESSSSPRVEEVRKMMDMFVRKGDYGNAFKAYELITKMKKTEEAQKEGPKSIDIQEAHDNQIRLDSI